MPRFCHFGKSSVSEAGLEAVFAEGDWSDTKSTPLHVCIEQLSNPHNNIHSEGESKVPIRNLQPLFISKKPITAVLTEQHVLSGGN